MRYLVYRDGSIGVSSIADAIDISRLFTRAAESASKRLHLRDQIADRFGGEVQRRRDRARALAAHRLAKSIRATFEIPTIPAKAES